MQIKNKAECNQHIIQNFLEKYIKSSFSYDISIESGNVHINAFISIFQNLFHDNIFESCSVDNGFGNLKICISLYTLCTVCIEDIRLNGFSSLVENLGCDIRMINANSFQTQLNLSIFPL